MSNSLSYRPDIDGLRSLAVLSVLFYHFNFGISGGYVGVDIFFVISGFLITSIIVREISQDKFSYSNFMARRIRRIYPPMLVVLCASLILGYLIMLPEDFINMGKSAVSQLFLVSNVFFYYETGGYFGGRGEIMPLLHTWSLSVEEQFYLVIPFLLVVLYRWFKQPAIRALVTITILASFFLSIYATKHYQTASFFVLPTRAWELGLGALIPILGIERCIRSAKLAEACSLTGLVMMLTAILMFNLDTAFPGLAALLPCGGAFLFIIANKNHQTLVSRLFSLRVFVGIGLISYSVYLWHWPLIAFSNYALIDTHNVTTKLSLLLASLFLGYLSWRYIEKYSRYILFPTNSTVYLSWFLTSTALVCIVVVIVAGNGFPYRFSPQVNNYALDYKNKPSSVRVDLKQASKNEFLPLGQSPDALSTDFFVWGDSHAQALYPVLNKLAKDKELSGQAAIYPGVLPILDFEPIVSVSLGKDAIDWNNDVVEYLTENSIKNVLMVSAWERYLRDINETEELKQKLNLTLEKLSKSGINIWILAQVPDYEYAVPRYLAYTLHKNGNTNKTKLSKQEYLNGKQFDMFSELATRVNIIDPSSYFTDQDSSYVSPSQNDEALYFDREHLSSFGAEALAPAFHGFIESLSGK